MTESGSGGFGLEPGPKTLRVVRHVAIPIRAGHDEQDLLRAPLDSRKIGGIVYPGIKSTRQSFAAHPFRQGLRCPGLAAKQDQQRRFRSLRIFLRQAGLWNRLTREVTGQKTVQLDSFVRLERRSIRDDGNLDHPATEITRPSAWRSAATGGTSVAKFKLEIGGSLHINPIGVSGSAAGRGKAALDVIAGEEMAIARFELRETGDSVSNDHVQFCSHEVAVVRVDAITGPRRRCGAAARNSVSAVKAVVGIGEPEAMAFDGQTHAGMRLKLKDAAHVMNILERDKIHVAIKFMIRWKQIVEGLMLAIVRIAIARGVGIFNSEARLGPGVGERITGLRNDHIRLLIDAVSGRAGAGIAKIP